MKSVAGLILAAGKSERMGSSKPLLKIYGKTFLEHIVEEARHSRLSLIRIVLGHHASGVLDTLPQFTNQAIINPEYEQGQLSSLQCGLRSLAGAPIEGLMVFLIDHPFVSSELLNQLITAFSEQRKTIVVPSFANRRGHPMIFASDLFPELLQAPLEEGAVSVVRRHQDQILHLNVGDPGVLIDIDTPEAYNEFVVRAGKT
jgi:molybdenum cofactor cytidylyltransferase